MKNQNQQIDGLSKSPKGKVNPVLSDIISVLFMPAGLFIMLIDSSLPKAYKVSIIVLLSFAALWILYSLVC
ncbi:MAG TPA: hypothetical protein VKZ95_04040 [Sphingobacteriaceae bacterium]|nr:hypothetical protein [Sphingobacteriaceae bacterium]